jgi:molecular chaperone DnaK (HSP70)
LSVDDGIVVVFAKAGGTFLEDEDFNNRVIDYFVKLCKKSQGQYLTGFKSHEQIKA